MSQQIKSKESSRFNLYSLLIAGLLSATFSCSNSNSTREQESWDSPVKAPELSNETRVESADDERTSWQNPALVIDKLGNIRNKTVADIGAGMGYFTFLMAEKGARVLAIDIEPDYIAYIQQLREESQMYSRNMIEPRLSMAEDPLIGSNEVDAALIVNAYTFLPERIEYLKKIDRGLKPNGILCIVDYKSPEVPVISEDTPVLELNQITDELRSAGFRILETDTVSLEYQFVITATSQL
jgi:ubiquinone/menaquinone biosynthesis C-methylase UbiE